METTREVINMLVDGHTKNIAIHAPNSYKHDDVVEGAKKGFGIDKLDKNNKMEIRTWESKKGFINRLEQLLREYEKRLKELKKVTVNYRVEIECAIVFFIKTAIKRKAAGVNNVFISMTSRRRRIRMINKFGEIVYSGCPNLYDRETYIKIVNRKKRD